MSFSSSPAPDKLLVKRIGTPRLIAELGVRAGRGLARGWNELSFAGKFLLLSLGACLVLALLLGLPVPPAVAAGPLFSRRRGRHAVNLQPECQITQAPTTPTNEPDDAGKLSLSWDCPFLGCGKTRVYEGGQPDLRRLRECTTCTYLVAVTPEERASIAPLITHHLI